MKRTALFISILLCAAASLFAGRQEHIILTPKGGFHSGMPMPADEPDVYYDEDTQEVIIDGDGFVTYYDVEIAAAPSWTVVLTTQVNGSYDTIDVSSLPQGDYLITIESPLGNIYEGYFDTW